MFCACGRRLGLRGTRWNPARPYNEQRYYYCNAAYSVVGEKRCRNEGTIRMDLAEQLIWDYVRSLLLDPQKLLEELQLRREKRREENGMIHDRIVMIGQELSGIETKQRMLLDLYLAGEVSREEFTAKKAELERKKKELTLERGEKETWVKDQEVTSTAVEEVKAFCATITKGMKEATFAEKRQILQMLEVKATYDGEQLAVSGGIPPKNLFTSSLPRYR
jgi:recombinase-like zinc beta ribbon protein